jgi:hypothetical protein
VSTNDYRRALEAAAKEYEALGEERRRIDHRLGELAQTIATLSRLCGFAATVQWGLTDACRTVLRYGGHAMTPIEVRDRLKSIGFDLSRYSNDLAAVHTILKRLNEAGEIRFKTNYAGAKSYIWEKPAKVATIGPDVAEFVRQRELERGARRKKESK